MQQPLWSGLCWPSTGRHFILSLFFSFFHSFFSFILSLFFFFFFLLFLLVNSIVFISAYIKTGVCACLLSLIGRVCRRVRSVPLAFSPLAKTFLATCLWLQSFTVHEQQMWPRHCLPASSRTSSLPCFRLKGDWYTFRGATASKLFCLP